MKKILLLLPSLTVGGMEKAAVTLANALTAAGNAVTVMTLEPVFDLKTALSDSVRLLHKPYKKHIGQKIPYLRHRRYDDGMWETRASANSLYRYYVGGETYDVEIAFFHGLPVKIISGSDNPRAVRLTWIHNDFTKIRGYQFNFKDFTAMQAAYRRFDRVVCVSEQARQGFIRTVGDTQNTQTIYNLLPVANIRALAQQPIDYRYPADALNVVLVGRLADSHKGQRRLIAALARLRREGKRVSLTLVGGGSDQELIADAVREHGAAAYVFMTGSRENPYPYIAQADLLVCASYYEGYNLTVAEALILGIPVLSTDCTGPREILNNGEFGLLVENSEQGLYDGLRQLCDHPDLLRRYKSKAAQRQDFFNEEAILKQITDLF